MHRNQLIAGSILFAALVILVISGSVILLRQRNSGQTLVGQRRPLQNLGYCNSNQVRPCIVSFNLDSHEHLVINVLNDYSFPSAFYLKIKRDEEESIYKCRKATGLSKNFSCIGERMPIGEELQFLMLSTKEDKLLAEGTFPIIGLAIATPEIFITPTPMFFHNLPE